MKKINNIYMLCAVCLALSATACSNEATTADDSGRHTVTIAGFSSRAGETTESFGNTGNTVAVYSLGTTDKCTYTYDGTKWVPQDNKELVTDLPARLVAVSPADANYTKFSIPQEQTTAALLKAADLMTSDEIPLTADYKNATVSPVLKHRLCKVIFTIGSYSSEYSGLGNNIEAAVKSNGGYYTPSNIVYDTNYTNSVSPLVTENANKLNKYEAIILPGKYAGQKIFEIKVNNAYLGAYLPDGAPEFVAGNVYSYTVNVMPRNLTLTFNAGTFSGWGDTSNESLLQ